MNLPRDKDASPEAFLLKAKLNAPLPRAEHVLRPRLLNLLTAHSEKITLIGAPPGYGKTTLLAQWRQTEGGKLPIAWVSLDEQDNDAVRLWAHVMEAFRQIAPEEAFGSNIFGEPDSNWKNLIETIKTRLPKLINGLTEFPQRVTLVLDDYHHIKRSECHKLITFFVEHLPETVQLVFSTRNDLPLPLGRWRAKGEVNEIRAEQLAFSEEEVAYLLRDRLHLNLDPGDIHTLLERTEGWPAAVYLAALSLRGKQDAHAFIEAFHGSNRFIVELLAEEVLATLPEEEREFLLLSSVLETLSAPLCEAVTRKENSGRLLRELEHSNLFVIPLDDNGEWYRYHHLFRDFLRYELSSTQPQLMPVLHMRAVEWFEQAGLVEEAINYAITAGEFAQAGLLVSRYWFGYAVSGQRAALERWLAALPEDLTNGDAALALVRAWISALQGRQEQSEHFLALAEDSSYEGKLPDGTASVEVGVALVRALFGYGGVQAALAAARRAEELEPPRQASLHPALTRFALGMNLYYSGEISEARKPLEEARRLQTAVGYPVMRITVLCALSFVACDEGDLEEAESLAREAHKVVKKFRLESVPQSTAVHIAQGRALAGRGKVAEAQIELERGVSTRRWFSSLNPWVTLVGLLALAPVRGARGDRDGARALLVEAQAIIERYPDAGMFPSLLARRERELSGRNRQDGAHTQELTERELAVLRLLDGERSNREIGRALYISPNTVKAHVKSIYRKLGVSSRETAAEQARARGLI